MTYSSLSLYLCNIRNQMKLINIDMVFFGIFPFLTEANAEIGRSAYTISININKADPTKGVCLRQSFIKT